MELFNFGIQFNSSWTWTCLEVFIIYFDFQLPASSFQFQRIKLPLPATSNSSLELVGTQYTAQRETAASLLHTRTLVPVVSTISSRNSGEKQ